MTGLCRNARTAMLLALLLSAMSVAPAAAYEEVGSISCSPTTRAWVYSKASVNVWHYWTGGSHYYYNPYRVYHEDNTQQQSVGWKVTWDFEKEYAGAYCNSI